ncbi:MAG: class I SAM-dependent methyltransferase [Candidatus Omnitrophica bacterium]|nr:class I SAM-dependent methyltransferase [Candidatus Omnitrophota bacterium]
MPTELPAQFYNLMFMYGGKQDAYHKGPHDSFMFVLWDAIARKLNKKNIVAEFGCGAGQLASLIREYGDEYVYGVDIAEKGIEIAKELNPEIPERFHIGSLYDETNFRLGEYNTAIFCEVLEHLDDDLKPLSFLPPETKVIISVPTAESREHVRCFKSQQEIHEHYGELINIQSIEEILIPINNPGNVHYWFIIDGVKI